MAFWTTNFMNKMRNEWLRRIGKIQYQDNNGTWYDAHITEKKVIGNKVHITCTTKSEAKRS